MVGKKFVLPYIVQPNAWNGKFDKLYRYGRVSALEDIDKALCYLTGTNYDTCKTIIDSINSAIDQAKATVQETVQEVKDQVNK